MFDYKDIWKNNFGDGYQVGDIIGSALGIQGAGKKLSDLATGNRDTINNALKQQQDAYNTQQGVTNQYTGNTGYQNSLKQAQQGAGQIANGMASQALGNARSSGMSKGAAADMAAQNAATGYQNALTGQQQAAMQSGMNAVQGANANTQAAQNLFTTNSQAENEKLERNMFGQLTQGAEAIGKGVNAALGGGTIGGGTSSDSRLKEFKEVGKKLEKHNKCKKDDLMWSGAKKDWNSLKWQGK